MYSLALLAFHKETLNYEQLYTLEIELYTLDPIRNLESMEQQWNKLSSSHNRLLSFNVCWSRIRWDVLIIIFHHMLIQKI